jgi:hypothetical protein
MSVVEVPERIGGVATRATLLRLCERADVDRALQAGDVVAARGRYSLPAAEESWVAAQLASARAANPFESGLRAIAADVPGLDVQPQVSVLDPHSLVARGWLVLRFSWEDVMFHADEVRAVIEAVVEVRTDALCPGCRAA